MSGSYKKNPWVQFLRRYGPIPNNDNMYDEQIQQSARRNNVRPLRFGSGRLFEEIVENFRSDAPRSVILTGTAGDGKTFLCREVWGALGGDEKRWAGDEKALDHKLASGRTLRVIRDLTELTESESHMLRPIVDAIHGDVSSPLYLIAANDGQLLQAFERLASKERARDAHTIIEDMVMQGELRTEREKEPLLLYNLSRQDSAGLMAVVLDAVSNHEGWKGCDGCPGQRPEPELRCPVWENQERMRDPLLRQRLISLLELSDHSGNHLPVRQLLILVSNMLLGHPEAPDRLLRCNDVPKVVPDRTYQASLYSNVLGENLSPLQRERTQAFEILGRFGLGEETSNRIDSLLVYGAFDPELHEQFDALVQCDRVYGAYDAFTRLQATYLEGATPENQQAFCEALRTQRQRLFFTAPAEPEGALPLWDLTVFRFAGEFLDGVLARLRQQKRVERRVLSRLVRGLNRVFTGLMTSDDQKLYLASSGSHSQARISRVLEHEIDVDRGRHERVAVELINGSPHLCVDLDRGERATLPLSLVRFEFLSRVAEGALPTNFSRECYEDILSFKSRVLHKWRDHSRSDQGSDFTLDTLSTEGDGRMKVHTISVRLGDPS